MVKNWVLITLTLLSIVLSAAFFYLTRKVNNTKELSSGYSPPDELGKNFDPTVNAPVFRVLEEDSSRNLLKLKMIFPEGFLREDITASLACEEQDIKIIKEGIGVGTGSEVFFAAFVENSKETTSLQGLCSDSSCKELIKQCILNIY